MAVGYARGQFWDDLVAPLLFDSWPSHDTGGMAQKSERSLVGAKVLFHSGTSLVCHPGRVCFSYACHNIRQKMGPGPAAVLATAIAVIALCAFDQLGLVPTARNAYLLHSASPYSPAERQQADELFARYRREGKPDEPVVASTWLFRYAHDRNLFWLDRLHDRPAPIWMLGDTAEEYAPLRISSDTINPASGIHLADYTLIDRRGRFVLLRKKQ